MASEAETSSGVAGRYANALFELATEQTALESVAGDLNRFNEALDAFTDLKRLVKSPVFTAEEQGRALAAILDQLKIDGLTKNFLLLVAKNRRLFATPDMIGAFRAMLARERGETSASVTAAAKLTEALKISLPETDTHRAQAGAEGGARPRGDARGEGRSRPLGRPRGQGRQPHGRYLAAH